MSKAALWATSTASSTKSRNAGSTSAAVASLATKSSVMPWNRIEAGGIVRCGSTRRLNACSGRTAPPTDHLALGDIAPEAGYAGEEQQLNATV